MVDVHSWVWDSRAHATVMARGSSASEMTGASAQGSTAVVACRSGSASSTDVARAVDATREERQGCGRRQRQEERGMTMQRLARDGNFQLIKDDDRKFPGLLIQGDTIFGLLADLEEEAPGTYALQSVRDWVETYEVFMKEAGLDLPYSR